MKPQLERRGGWHVNFKRSLVSSLDSETQQTTRGSFEAGQRDH